MTELLLSSNRVLPIDIKEIAKKPIVQRKQSLPFDKITALVDSTVSIRPQKISGDERIAKRYNRRESYVVSSNAQEKA